MKLLLSELNEALAIDMDTNGRPYFDSGLQCLDMRDILSVCSSLVTTIRNPFDLSDGHSLSADVHVRLAHSSVKEFLMSSSIRSNACAKYAVVEDVTHAYLAKACMAYLIRFDSPLRADDVDKNFFVDYVAEHWITHLHGSKVNPESEIFRDLIWNMFDPRQIHYRNWIQLNNIDMPWRTPDLSGDISIIPPLYSAAFLNFGKVCRSLVRIESDVDALGGLLGSALQAAAFKGHTGIVEVLLKAGFGIRL